MMADDGVEWWDDEDEAEDAELEGSDQKRIVTPLEPDTGAERTARYDKRRRARGQVRIAVWVPADRADELRQFAARLRGSMGEA